MPTYQYACTACGHELEAVQSFSDDALTVCPACGGKLRKRFGAVGIVFKGSGFYRNDSRASNGSSASSSTPSSSTSSSSTASSTASESSSTSSSSTSSTSSDSSTKAPAAAPAA